MTFLAAFALATLLALILTPLGVRLAWVTGYLDNPEARKLHTTATPLLGGMVVFIASLSGWLAAGHAMTPQNEVLFLVGGGLVALIVGLWDDRVGMAIGPKLVGQAVAVSLLLASGNTPDLGMHPLANAAITLFMLVALMNAVNFLDNMNGLIGGLSAIALAGFAWDSWGRGALGVASCQLALAGACAGFLRYNFPQARIFLGDAGSLFLGYCLATSAVLAWNGLPAGWGHMGPILMIGYPIFDMFFVVITRVREGRGIGVGGKDHSNHRLATRLGSRNKAVLLVWATGAALFASGLAVQSLNTAGSAILVAGAWLGAFLLAGKRLAAVPVESGGPPPSP